MGHTESDKIDKNNKCDNTEKKEEKCKLLITDTTKNDLEEGKDEKKENDDETVLSLDSSDTDDETNGSSSRYGQHLSFRHNKSKDRYKGHKFSLNRSKSTSSPSSASMS